MLKRSYNTLIISRFYIVDEKKIRKCDGSWFNFAIADGAKGRNSRTVKRAEEDAP